MFLRQGGLKECILNISGHDANAIQGCSRQKTRMFYLDNTPEKV